MKRRALLKLQEKRQFVHDTFTVGIDPAKAKHQAQLLDPHGLPLGSSFSFAATFDGFHHQIWKHLAQRLPQLSRDEMTARLVFAVETSCNLWQTLVHYLTAHGFRVVLVSPLATCHARPSMSGDFSRTDPKDAYLIAQLAWKGDFLFYRQYDPHARAMHRLAITYDKLRKNLQQNYNRLRSQLEALFPELLKVLKLDSLTARHLLSRYLLPEDYLQMDLDREARQLLALSGGQHGRETLEKLQVLARRSVGISKEPEEALAERLTMNAWLEMIETLEHQIKQVTAELARLSKQTPYHGPVSSLKGISDLLAALFIAELRAPGHFRHWKQIERVAGYNLYVCDSGHYKGRRRITHLGNDRLRWVIFCMLSETTKYVPEIRAKYLRRRLSGSKNRQKNLVACVPKLLGLLGALTREERLYELREEAYREVEHLEKEIEKRKQQFRRSRNPGRMKTAA